MHKNLEIFGWLASEGWTNYKNLARLGKQETSDAIHVLEIFRRKESLHIYGGAAPRL